MPARVRRDILTTLEGGALSGNALSNDSGVSTITQVRFGNGVTVPVPAAGVTLQGNFGVLTIRADGTYSYTATTGRSDQLAAGATGTDWFTYTATGIAGTGSSDIRVTVTGTNDAPVLAGSGVTLAPITEDQVGMAGQTIASFLSSTDVDSGALRGIAISGLGGTNGGWQYSLDGGVSWQSVGAVSSQGALLLRSTDRIRFEPDTVNGTSASFTYRAWDQTTGSAGQKVDLATTGGSSAFSTNSVTATLAVASINDAPVAQAGTAEGLAEGPPVTGRVVATDVDGPALSYALIDDSAVGGSVALDPSTGNFTFTAAAGFSGFASFRFLASDGALSSSAETVTIRIASAGNSAPVAVADRASTPSGTPVVIDVLANDSDPDNQLLVITGVTAPASGSASIQSGKLVYQPASDFTGEDSFSYTISDGAGGLAEATVTVAVAPPSASPSAVTVTFRQSSNGYTGTVDTTLREARSTTLYPDAIVLHSALESGKDFQPLLRFESIFGDGPGQVPLGATIVSATLRLEVTEGSAAGGTIHRMLTNWSEGSTWSSLGNGVQIDGIEASPSGVITVGAVALGSRAFDVTSSLVAWNAAGGTAGAQNAANLGWLFEAAGLDSWDFTSSEGTVRPVLSVTYTHAGATAASLPLVSISAGPALESAGKAVLTLTLSQASSAPVEVRWTAADHDARAGSDFAATLQTLTFAAGETSKTIEVALLNDQIGERPESFFVHLLSAINARIDAPAVQVRIIDDDLTPAPFSPISATVVAVHNLADGQKYRDGGTGVYGIGDPSAIAYIPSLGALFIADSEHDEAPYYSSTNLFSVRTDGSYIGNHSLTSFTREPTGLAFNSANGFLYIADDDRGGVFWVSPTQPSVRLGFFGTSNLGFLDTEDLKFDPLTGNVYVLDGLMKQIIELTPTGQFVHSIKLPSILSDAEALAYDPRHDVFFVGSGASSSIWVLNHEGQILQTLTTLSAFSPRAKLKGFELAPSSNPNDGDALSLYVVDYGADQQNDGRLFELYLGGDWFS